MPEFIPRDKVTKQLDDFGNALLDVTVAVPNTDCQLNIDCNKLRGMDKKNNEQIETFARKIAETDVFLEFFKDFVIAEMYGDLNNSEHLKEFITDMADEQDEQTSDDLLKKFLNLMEQTDRELLELFSRLQMS